MAAQTPKAPRQVPLTPDRASDLMKINKKATVGLYHILPLADKEEIENDRERAKGALPDAVDPGNFAVC